MPPHKPRLLSLLTLALVTTTSHAQLQTARLVKDANRTPGDFNAKINWVVPLKNSVQVPFLNNVVFPRDTLAHGSELWISDGTVKGTRLLSDITPGPGSTYPEDPVAFGDDWSTKPRIAFRTQRDSSGDEVWVTDGTATGTVQVYKSTTPAGNGEVRVQAGIWHGVFFENIDWEMEDSTEVFFSDGTVAGTRSLNPIGEEGRRFSNPYCYLPSTQECHFIANDNEIWTSNGYGTTKRVSVAPGTTPQLLAFSPFGLAIAIGDFYSSELWYSNAPHHIARLDMPAGTAPAKIEQMLEHLTKFYFIRNGENQQRELWTTDGTTAGTRKITLLNGGLGPESQMIGPIRAWSDAVYFAARNENGDHELWRTDGTTVEGTRRIASFTPPQTSLAFYETPSTEDFLYFQTTDQDGHQQLWRTQGDAASTRPVKGTPNISPANEWPQMAVTRSGGVFFAADPLQPQNALWKLRGKTNGAIRLTKPEKTTGWGTAPAPINSQTYEMLGGKLLTFVNTGSGHELWTMMPDGKGARSLWKAKSPLVEYGTLGFQGITPHGVIFSYDDGADVRQVWITDGTKPGTRLLGDHGTANNGGYPRNFVKLGDTWYYSVVNNQELSGAGLWRTDGTPAGTTKVVAADGTAPGPEPDDLVVFNDHLYFFASQRGGQTALWRSDGTAAGTVIVKDEWYNDSFQILHALSVAGGELTFSITTSLTSLLWHSDGTTAGTLEVPYPHGSFNAGIYSPAVDLNGDIIFQGRKDYSYGVQLWRYDGEETTQLRDGITEQHVYPWHTGSRRQAVVGSQLFYSGLDNYIAELWVTDGTNAGTRLVKDINPGANFASDPDEMLAVGNLLYFTARDEAHGTELWRSDGTETGTTRVADIEPGPGSSEPKDLKVMNGKLYFTATRRDVGRELFVIDLPQ